MQPIAVIFDMDGLMLDTERMSHAAWMRALGEANLQLEHTAYLELVGRASADTQRMVMEWFGPEFRYTDLRSRIMHFYELDIEQNGIPTKPGLFELLNFIDSRGIQKAIATSAVSHFAARKLRVAGINGYFSTMVCSDMVALGKPAPDLFLEAARQIGIPTNRCIVLEDSEAGILAARSAGMLSIMIPDLKLPSPEIQALCYRVLPTLDDVIPVLQDFIQNDLPDRPGDTSAQQDQ